MNKKFELNTEIKKAVAQALFILLKNKSLNEITICELVNKAGIARASFYRNFKSKEEVIHFYLKDILNAYKDKYAADLAHIARYENIVKTFKYVLFHRFELECLFEAKLGQILLEEINAYIIIGSGLENEKSILKYPFYSYAGALYNVIHYWITSGCKESSEEIAKAFFNSFHINKNTLV